MNSPNENPSAIRPGDVIGGKYRVEKIIGQGGMGTVVRARHTLLEQDVAIKVLANELAADPQYAARFLREAQTAVSIKGEHVVRVLDVGTRENGAPFMVMEYLQGNDLGALVEESGPLHVQDAVDYVLQACEALAEAHVAGLTHRDIKPSNLFLAKRSDGSPMVKLLDFGIAKPASATDTRLTATGAAMGSPSYMSPEQVRNAKDVDHRSDIWSLGASLHELLTGTPPFHAETFPALCAAIIADDPTPIRSVRSDVPLELEAVIAKCLEKKIDGRYPDVAVLALALAPFGGPDCRVSVERITKIIRPVQISAELSAPRISLTSSPSLHSSAFAATAASTSMNVPPRPPPPKRSPVVYALFVVMAILLFGGVYLGLRDKPNDPASAGENTLATTSPPSTAPVVSAAATIPVTAPSASVNTPAAPSPTDLVDAAMRAQLASASPHAGGTNAPLATNRPLGSAKPISTTTKKKGSNDPFADQH